MIAVRRAWLAALPVASLPVAILTTAPVHAAEVSVQLECQPWIHDIGWALTVSGIDEAEPLEYEAVGANGVRHSGEFSYRSIPQRHVANFGYAISAGLTGAYDVTVTDANDTVLLSTQLQTCDASKNLPVPPYPGFDAAGWGVTHDNEFITWEHTDSGELTVEINPSRAEGFDGVIPEVSRSEVEYGRAPQLPEGAVNFGTMDGSYSGYLDTIYFSAPGVSEPVEVYHAQTDGEWAPNGTLWPSARPSWYSFHDGESEWCEGSGQGRLIAFRAVHPETQTVLGEHTYEQNCSDEDPVTSRIPVPPLPPVSVDGEWVTPQDTDTLQWRILLDGTMQVQILPAWTTFTTGGATFNYGSPDAPVDPGPGTAPDIVRLDGGDRYQTAAKLVLENYEPGLETIYLATGRDFPDALAGAALAGAQSAPVLLTRPDRLPAATRAALSELQPERIVVLGGPTVVNEGVLEELTSLGLAHVRIYGTDRYRTAAAISALMDPADVVVVATGLTYPDALAGAAAAGSLNGPLLLTRHISLPNAAVVELVRHNPQRVLVLGGDSAVDDAVMAQITELGFPVERVYGVDRYGTAAAIATLWSEGATETWVSTGGDFADALASSPLAARQEGPVLLTRPTSLPGQTRQAMLSLSPDTIHVMGGTDAVGDEVLQQLRDLPWE